MKSYSFNFLCILTFAFTLAIAIPADFLRAGNASDAHKIPNHSEPQSGLSTVIKVGSDDVDVNMAIKKARANLPLFWEKFSKPEKNEIGFALKIAVRDDQNIEHFWLQNIERKDGKFFGIIDNQPSFVKNVKMGQKIEFLESDISDWTYVRDGKLVGNYTLRILIKRLSPDQAKEYENLLEKE